MKVSVLDLFLSQKKKKKKKKKKKRKKIKPFRKVQGEKEMVLKNNNGTSRGLLY